MSTYLPGVTDTGFNPVQYSPNFPYMMNALQKATARYETNFEKMSQGYQSIMQAPIINEGVSSKRDQYLTQIKDQLKTISASDLSIQSNVNSAENLYAPFWEDKEMLAHIKDSKARMSEYEKQQRIAEENPELDGSTPLSLMSWQMDKIKKSTDPDIIKKVSTQKAIKLENLPKSFNEWLKDQDWKIESTNAADGRIITMVNGEGTQSTFSQLYNSYIGNGYSEHYQTYGEYYKMQAIEGIKSEYKNANKEISDEEAEAMIPEFYEKQVLENYDQRIKDYETEKITILKNFDRAEKENNIAKAEALAKRKMDIDYLINDAKDELTALKEKKTINGVDYQTVKDKIRKNPTSYFAQTALQKDMLTAGVMAANKQSLTVKKDDSYWEQVKLEEDVRQFNETNAREWENIRQDAAEATAGGSTTAGKKNESLVYKVDENGNKMAYANTVPIVEPATANVDIKSAIVRMQSKIADMSAQGTDELVKTLQKTNSSYFNGLLNSSEISALSVGLGIAPEDIKGRFGIDAANAYDKAYANIKENLKKNGVDVSNVKGPVGLLTAVAKHYTAKFNSDLNLRKQNKINNTPDPELDKRIANELTSTYIPLKKATDLLDKAYAENINFEKAISSKLSNPVYKDVTIKNKDGKYELVTAQNLAKQFPLIDPNTGRKTGKSIPINILEQYINGDLKFLKIEEISEDYNKVIDQTTGEIYDLTQIIEIYGKPEVLKKKRDAAYELLGKQIDQNTLAKFQDETGYMARAITFFSPNEDKDYADAIVSSIFTEPGKLTMQDDKYLVIGANETLTELINKELIPLINSSPSKGLTAVSLYNIGAIDPSKRNIKFKYDLKTLGAGKDLTAKLLAAGYNGSFTLEVANDAQIKGFPQKYNSAYYDLLLKKTNTPINQSPVEEETGLKYSFYKDADNNIWYKAGFETITEQVDPKTGQKSQVYKWMDANPNKKGQEYSESNGYDILPSYMTIEDYIEALRSALPDQFLINSNISQQLSPAVSLQQTYAQKERFNQLRKTITQ